MTANTGSITSAQAVFDGSYDLALMKLKARHDFNRSMQRITNFHFALMDFAVTVASLADWAWMLHARHNRAWKSQKNPQNAFVRLVAQDCSAVAALTDLANEYKHADRTRKSVNLQKLEVRTVKIADMATLPNEWNQNALDVADVGLRFIPFFVTDSGKLFYKTLGHTALNWWDSFEPTAAMPP